MRRSLAQAGLQRVIAGRAIRVLLTHAQIPGNSAIWIRGGLGKVLRIVKVEIRCIRLARSSWICQTCSMTCGGDGVAFIGTNQMASDGTDIADLQHHVRGQRALDIEVEVKGVRHRVICWVGAYVQARIVRPVQLVAGKWTVIGEGIGFRTVASDIRKRIGKAGAATEISCAERILEPWRITQVLELTFFRVAVVVEAKAAAYGEVMRAFVANQLGRTGTRRPGKTKTGAKVIPLGGRATSFVAARVRGKGKSRRSAWEGRRGLTAGRPAGDSQSLELVIAVRGLYVPGDAVVDRQVVGNLPAVLAIHIVLVGACIDHTA